MSTGERRLELDGIRGVAVLLVVACHSNFPVVFGAGSVGVTIFFTLSGYLISSLLLAERQRTGRVAFGGFYLRRARRLLPAMLVMVAVVAGFQFTVGIPTDAAGVLMVVFYLGNIAALHGFDLTALGHTWSLAIEEQFYLVWPVVLVAVMRRRSLRALGWVTVAGVVASNIARLIVWDGGAGGGRIYGGTDTRADALLVGCLVAVVLHSGRMRLPGRVALPTMVVAAVGAAGLSLSSGWWLWMGVPTFVPWLTALALVAAVQHGPRFPMLAARPLVLVGQRSYGLYLWHVPILWFTPTLLGLERGLGSWLLGVGIAWGVTLLSWRFVEEPFLRPKTRARVSADRRPSPVGGLHAATLEDAAAA